MIDYDNEKELLEVIKRYKISFLNASDRLKNDKKFILKAMDAVDEQKQFFYSELSIELRDDKNFLLEVLKRSALAIIKASPRLKNDKEIAIAVFESNPKAIIYVSEEIKESLKNVKEEKIIEYLQYLIRKEKADELSQELENNHNSKKRVKI